MSITHTISSDQKRVDIAVKGRFDYKLSQTFRDTYRNLPGSEDISYHIDLSETEFMDSAALGMLLLLREYAKCHGGSVSIEQPGSQVESTLKVANFDQLFTINFDNLAA